VISVVIETFNLADDRDADAAATITALVAVLAPQLAALDAELVITQSRTALAATCSAALAYPARWLDVPIDATYYEHKNRGFDATTGDIVAFIDGDCMPSAAWLAAITAPIATRAAEVVAGATTYPGPLAAIANQLDFPVFAGAASGTVRNFFANNVAFARATFAARHYPTIGSTEAEPNGDAVPSMFHGQCQVLALRLAEAGIAIVRAASARVVHAPPKDVRAWLQVRLLRGADCAALMPFVVGSYAPFASPVIDRLGALPGLAVLGVRAVTGTFAAVRRGPRLPALALVAACTIVDAIGAVAAPAVYRRFRGQIGVARPHVSPTSCAPAERTGDAAVARASDRAAA
jgi:hypothetical protein